MDTRAPLPEHISRYGLDLSRWRVGEAPELHELVTANVEHLRPFMAWIEFEPQTVEQRADLIDRWGREWAAGGDVVMVIRRHGATVGSAGLHRRAGPDTLEIGYWVDHRHLRQGIATDTSRALTDLAFTIPGIEVVQIAHDVANLASAAVPARLGFRRNADRPAHTPSGSAGTGIEGVWEMTRSRWRSPESL